MDRTNRPTTISCLVVGEFRFQFYQPACVDALNQLGHSATAFRTGIQVKSADGRRNKWLATQERLNAGPKVWSLNVNLIRTICRTNPDVVWLYNRTPVTPLIIRVARALRPKTLWAQYTNDNPFIAPYKPNPWRGLIKSLPLFDLNFAYRAQNQDQLRAAVAKNVDLLRSYFMESEDFPEEVLDPRFVCDVVFTGHYEDDGRLEALLKLAERGYKINLFGGDSWNRASIDPNGPLGHNLPVKPVFGDDYRRSICGAKIALCFLSKLNRDTYTRRNFQIPAMGVLMLSEYTDDLDSMFKSDVDAAYFNNLEELVSQVERYLTDDELRQQVAASGLARVHRDGHSVVDRMRFFAGKVQDLIASRATL